MTSPPDPLPNASPQRSEEIGDDRPGMFPPIDTAGPPKAGFTRPTAPPLRISHVMLFTACSAVHLVVQRWWLKAFLPQGADPGNVASIFLTAEAVCAGPALAMILLWPAWRARGY